jgi:hypothetical protein
MNFNSIQFPVIKNIAPKNIGDQLVSIKPMTPEEAAGGRKIRPYPVEYTKIESLEALKAIIIEKLDQDPLIKPLWLKADITILMPFNFDEDVYYESYRVLDVGYMEPPMSIYQDIVNGGSFCILNPEHWNIDDINKILKEIYVERTSNIS